MIESLGQSIWNALDWALGLEAQKISFWQMALRAVVGYIVALAAIRLGNQQRFMGKYAAFDVIVGFIFAATIGRSLGGSEPFLSLLGVALVIVGMHRLFSALAFRFERFENLVKGSPQLLIKDGQLQEETMQKTSLSKNDIELALRLQEKLSQTSQIKLARLERSGDISVTPQYEQIPGEKSPQDNQANGESEKADSQNLENVG